MASEAETGMQNPIFKILQTQNGTQTNQGQMNNFPNQMNQNSMQQGMDQSNSMGMGMMNNQMDPNMMNQMK